MLELFKQKSFKKSIKKYKGKDEILKELIAVVELLVNEQPIPTKYKDHELKGKLKRSFPFSVGYNPSMR